MQDLNLNMMTYGELGFYKKLVADKIYSVPDIYSIMYEYKT